ncbi:hypothetical protein TSAR_004086 [Trichomalopsis sarcophagae]|uniref:Uncharacterized protein n=1 Tax=Trichomalopsis sarcophagae TaxID=543379 RepID=A0A232EW27_9HYME|nr:hypothetical protein TSAR_004086 [Trichomalopsis sarcophagae]
MRRECQRWRARIHLGIARIHLYMPARSATSPFSQLHSRTLLSTCGKVVLCERKCMRKFELCAR